MERDIPPPHEPAVQRRELAPAVVLADGAGRGEFETLQRLLGEALGCPVVRLSGSDLAAPGATLSFVDSVLEVSGLRIQPVVVWIRHAAAGTIYSHSPRDRAGLGLREAESWSSLLDFVTAAAAVAVPGGRPGLARQLTGAAQLGLRVPGTVVTTDVDRAMGLLAVSRVVVKVPDARLVRPVLDGRPVPVPQVVGRGDTVAWMDGTFPAVVQEYVEHVRELRIYYTDGGVCAFEVNKPAPGSIWTEPERVTVRRVACPDPLAETARALSKAWRMSFAAFDILVTRSGRPVFLEANADGDWLWYERKAGWHSVSFMVAAMVKEMYVRALAGRDRDVKCPLG